MIHYHVLPAAMSSEDHRSAFGGRHVMVSHQTPASLEWVADSISSFAVDNGAFTAWKSGTPVTDWEPFYQWARSVNLWPSFDWALIPDVIGGTEEENDHLLLEWVRKCPGVAGVPVFHLHESLDRLRRLCSMFPTVALGSSGSYAHPKTSSWWRRMREAWGVIPPETRVHGLRMLDPDIVARFPFRSCDSSSAARNATNPDGRWGIFSGARPRTRAMAYCERLEAVQSPRSLMEHQETIFRGVEG